LSTSMSWGHDSLKRKAVEPRRLHLTKANGTLLGWTLVLRVSFGFLIFVLSLFL
jgi:hypothetical protein